ncbi:ABC transporter ATP-binding protein [Staphylospora marina]|uniref:ABC transporter ATP-binding protein n=1 Tax=Staphylospora marina TaxID=2490858 RepID=UPI000F5B963B|nr:ABC transporter ATP-binding protein [Staphylospora marina]
MNALETRALTLSYGEKAVIDGLNLAIPKNKITVLIGANGSGKSTLLRSLARILKPAGGTVLLDAQDIFRLPTREVAKKLAILPQSPSAPEGLTVLQLVRQGRYPHQQLLRSWSEADERAVNHALQATGMTELAEHPVDSLSGGQRQRAWIAMTLAQETETILLDEPTTYLDLSHQIEILDLLHELNREQKRTIVMVLHDLNLACRYADHIIAVHGGGAVAQGRPEDVITADLIQTVFGLRCRIIEDPVCGTPLCLPYSRAFPSRKQAGS